ncbi:esterase [Thalassotalea sp. HSM 43]|uniref:alpha-L-rhamnosidase-related protein n=1 Tax=Thalassotalea sp. HSM 43 TaxID=2552945 RepID=UPI0010809024|nr:esterase [Thalassotalea sp. HSM 43]QBY03835.1 esterase [Thalassotalea sp. HSM 43]
MRRLSITLVILAAALGMAACQGPINKGTIQTIDVEQSRVLPAYYIRGGFNNWSTDAKFEQTKNGLYQVEVAVGLGIHEYKIASADWQTQLMIANRRHAVVDLNREDNLQRHYPLAINQTESADLLLVEKAGVYRFTLDTRQSYRPIVTINRVKDLVLESDLQHFSDKQSLTFQSYDKQSRHVVISAQQSQSGLRSYVHSTDQSLRDPVPQINGFKEDAKQPYIRTGSIAFDGLFALAIDEMKKLSVSDINDGSYNFGQSIKCDCFKTGQKWDYVWTRDLSYAAHLSLALLDPERVKNSLEYKLSPYRQGVQKPEFAKGDSSGLQIIQDTGSGGSWPISTDRVTWAFGAQAALQSLDEDSQSAFAKTALNALINTLENDRIVAFDAQTGLYMGEQSFLDWREQSYADWVKDDLSYMATSISVSTNAAHYQALVLASQLAEKDGQNDLAKRYRSWAEQLKQAINDKLWLEEYGMYSSLTAGHFDKTAMPKFDWLGQSLAIITGIASGQQSQQILANYPHGPMGAPVIFPQQPDIRIYHNRAIWPFVTAYGVNAAIKGDNAAVVDAGYNTLIRGAALNLSNMENLEWLTGQAIYLQREDVSKSGPVINSKYQLWSVAGYLSMVIHNVFGVQQEQQQLQFKPYLTAQLVEQYFADSQQLTLFNLQWQQRTLNVTMELPQQRANDGVYQLESIELNGKPVANNISTQQLLDSDNEVRIRLATAKKNTASATYVEALPTLLDNKVFAPKEPVIGLRTYVDNVSLFLDDRQQDGIAFNIIKNGVVVAKGLRESSWQDPQPMRWQSCYSAQAVFVDSGLVSHNAKVQCVQPGITIDVDDSRVQSSIAYSRKDYTAFIKDFGDVDDQLLFGDIAVEQAGHYALQLSYRNENNKTNTGITAGVKWLQIEDEQGNVIQSGVIQMPHISASSKPVYSTPVSVELGKGNYQVRISDFYNMSYLQNNQTYTQAGGIDGSRNQVDVYHLRLLPVPK